MRGGAREHNILQLDDKQVPDIHDNRHRHKETGDSTRTKNRYKTWTLNKAIMSRDMYIDLPDNNLPHISQTN